MEKWHNLPYLLAAYAAVWVGVAGYLFWMAMRLRRLEKGEKADESGA